ncbi:hypothetical protein BH09PAT2_BH09PAT2_01230 [soil metagenome]
MSIKQELPTTYRVNLGNEQIPIDTHAFLGGQEKYCRRSEREVLENLVQVRKVLSYISGLDKHTPFEQVGPFIELASLEDDSQYYQEMRQRCNEVLMPPVGLNPNEPLEVSKFDTLFTNACKASDDAVGKGKEMLEDVVDSRAHGRMDMLQESKYSDTPLLLMENIFRGDDEPKRCYESLRKFMMAYRMMPELINQDKLKTKGIGNDIFNVLTKQGVFGNEPLLERNIIAKVYLDTGECVSWDNYDPDVNTELLEGKDEIIYENGNYEQRPWKQMFYSLPCRNLENGLPVYVDGRDKSDASAAMKVLRKLETSEDHFAIRLIFDEQQSEITEQIGSTFQNMIDAFEKVGWTVQLNSEEGYTNTITEEIKLYVGGEEKILNKKENSHNVSTSSERRVGQIDWVVTTPTGRRMQFEVQSMDTIAELNRRLNSKWNDASYKVNQFLKPFEYYEEASIANALFPPYYMQGIDVTHYEEDLYHTKHDDSMWSPSNNKLPK